MANSDHFMIMGPLGYIRYSKWEVAFQCLIKLEQFCKCKTILKKYKIYYVAQIVSFTIDTSW
jgi:hypothetical protein